MHTLRRATLRTFLTRPFSLPIYGISRSLRATRIHVKAFILSIVPVIVQCVLRFKVSVNEATIRHDQGFTVMIGMRTRNATRGFSSGSRVICVNTGTAPHGGGQFGQLSHSLDNRYCHWRWWIIRSASANSFSADFTLERLYRKVDSSSRPTRSYPAFIFTKPTTAISRASSRYIHAHILRHGTGGRG
jgi:hypothetical protein